MVVLRSVWIMVLLCYSQSQPGEAQVGITQGGADANHIVLVRGDVGEADDAVKCITDRRSCCGAIRTGNGEGDWYSPIGRRARERTSSNLWYQEWSSQEVRLNYRGDGTSGTTGLFRCDILDNGGTRHQFYVGMYPPDPSTEGALSVVGPMEFNLVSGEDDPPVYRLTCTSTGGPVTTVNWTSPAGAGGTKAQSVTNLSTATYTNTLTVTGRHTGDYMCSVSNARTASPVTRILTVTAASPPTGLRAILNQDSKTITVSWTPPSPPPTGYEIYYQATDGGADSGNRTITDGSTDQFNVTGRNRDSYDITIVATYHFPSIVVGPVGTIIAADDPISTDDSNNMDASTYPIAIGTSMAALLITGGSVLAVLIYWWYYQRHKEILVMDNVTAAGYMDGNNSAYGYVEELVRVR